jgi:hypothetical protein
MSFAMTLGPQIDGGQCRFGIFHCELGIGVLSPDFAYVLSRTVVCCINQTNAISISFSVSQSLERESQRHLIGGTIKSRGCAVGASC